MTLGFVNIALLTILAVVASSRKVDHLHGIPEQELLASDSLSLLQITVSKASRKSCPVPDVNSAAPAKVAKSCPPKADDDLWGFFVGNTCLDGNRAYKTFSEAWNMCGVTAGCGAILRFSNGKFYLRRATDPDDPSITSAQLFTYKCDQAAQTLQNSAQFQEMEPQAAETSPSSQSVAGLPAGEPKAENSIAETPAAGQQQNPSDASFTLPHGFDFPEAEPSAETSTAEAQLAGTQADRQQNSEDGSSLINKGAQEADQLQKPSDTSATIYSAPGFPGIEQTPETSVSEPQVGVEAKPAAASPILGIAADFPGVEAKAETDIAAQQTVGATEDQQQNPAETSQTSEDAFDFAPEPPIVAAESDLQQEPTENLPTLQKAPGFEPTAETGVSQPRVLEAEAQAVDFEELEPEAEIAAEEPQARDAETSLQQSPTNTCTENGFTLLGQFRGGYEQMEERYSHALELVKSRSLSFLEPEAINLHKQLLMDIEEKGVPGSFAETGVAKGGSALLLASLKNPLRCIHLYDTFEGIPEPSKHDGSDVWNRYNEIQAGNAGNDYYGYMDNLESFVQRQFTDANLPPAESGVFFHKGLFQDTFHPTGLLAYVHLDGDWYESTRVVLERAMPMLSTNGIMILDDAYSWSGASDAVHDYFGIELKRLRELPFRSTIDISKDGKMFEIVKDTRLYIKRVE